MFDRFSERAKKTMSLARQAALRLQHDYIDAAHILLGIADEGTGVAVNVLNQMGVTPTALREQVEQRLPKGRNAVAALKQLPFTPRGKRLLEGSLEAARELGHNYIGTEHLLLGAMRLTEPPIPEVIQALGLDLARVRSAVGVFLAPRGEDVPASPERRPLVHRRPVVHGTAVVFGPDDRVQRDLLLPALRDLGCTEVNVHDIAGRWPPDLASLRYLVLRAEFVVVAMLQQPAEAGYVVGRLCHGLTCQPILVVDGSSPLANRPQLPAVFVVEGAQFDAVATRAAFDDFLRRHRDAQREADSG